MRLLSTLRLLVKPEAPTAGVAQGALYFDSALGEPLYHNGSDWVSFDSGAATVGYPTFVQTTTPDAGQTAGFDKWVWIDTSNTPPIVNVETSTDVATTTSTYSSVDDLELLILMGAL